MAKWGCGLFLSAYIYNGVLFLYVVNIYVILWTRECDKIQLVYIRYEITHWWNFSFPYCVLFGWAYKGGFYKKDGGWNKVICKCNKAVGQRNKEVAQRNKEVGWQNKEILENTMLFSRFLLFAVEFLWKNLRRDGKCHSVGYFCSLMSACEWLFPFSLFSVLWCEVLYSYSVPLSFLFYSLFCEFWLSIKLIYLLNILLSWYFSAFSM